MIAESFGRTPGALCYCACRYTAPVCSRPGAGQRRNMNPWKCTKYPVQDTYNRANLQIIKEVSYKLDFSRKLWYN